jgi:hypothetical protein
LSRSNWRGSGYRRRAVIGNVDTIFFGVVIGNKHLLVAVRFGVIQGGKLFVGEMRVHDTKAFTQCDAERINERQKSRRKQGPYMLRASCCMGTPSVTGLVAVAAACTLRTANKKKQTGES